MNRRQARKVGALERRRRTLKARIAEYRQTGDPDRARAELAAIDWALRIVRAADEDGLLAELEVDRVTT